MSKKLKNNWKSEQRKKAIIQILTENGVCPKLPHQKKMKDLEACLTLIQPVNPIINA